MCFFAFFFFSSFSPFLFNKKAGRIDPGIYPYVAGSSTSWGGSFPLSWEMGFVPYYGSLSSVYVLMVKCVELLSHVTFIKGTLWCNIWNVSKGRT